MEKNPKNEIIIYQAENGKTQVDVQLQDETVWLTQDMMSKLFDTIPQNITMHIKNIYEEQEQIGALKSAISLFEISLTNQIETIKQIVVSVLTGGCNAH